MAQRVEETGIPVVYANLVGGQDELVFDGGSFAVSPSADGPVVTARCASFVESLDVFDIAVPDRGPTHDRYPTISVTPAVTHIRTPMAAPIAEPLDELAEIWETLVLGARDYVRKSGFTKACLGLSGGVDSSIVGNQPPIPSIDHDQIALVPPIFLAQTVVPRENQHRRLPHFRRQQTELVNLRGIRPYGFPVVVKSIDQTVDKRIGVRHGAIINFWILPRLLFCR